MKHPIIGATLSAHFLKTPGRVSRETALKGYDKKRHPPLDGSVVSSSKTTHPLFCFLVVIWVTLSQAMAEYKSCWDLTPVSMANCQAWSPQCL